MTSRFDLRYQLDKQLIALTLSPLSPLMSVMPSKEILLGYYQSPQGPLGDLGDFQQLVPNDVLDRSYSPDESMRRLSRKCVVGCGMLSSVLSLLMLLGSLLSTLSNDGGS